MSWGHEKPRKFVIKHTEERELQKSKRRKTLKRGEPQAPGRVQGRNLTTLMSDEGMDKK